MEQTYKEMHLFIFPTFTIEREREREKSISGESGADYKIEITTEKKTPPEFPTDWPSLNTASNEKWENIKSFFPLNIFFFICLSSSSSSSLQSFFYDSWFNQLLDCHLLFKFSGEIHLLCLLYPKMANPNRRNAAATTTTAPEAIATTVTTTAVTATTAATTIRHHKAFRSS